MDCTFWILLVNAIFSFLTCVVASCPLIIPSGGRPRKVAVESGASLSQEAEEEGAGEGTYKHTRYCAHLPWQVKVGTVQIEIVIFCKAWQGGTLKLLLTLND